MSGEGRRVLDEYSTYMEEYSTSCSWLASCTEGPVVLSFSDLSLRGAGSEYAGVYFESEPDAMIVYDGENADAPVIATLSGKLCSQTAYDSSMSDTGMAYCEGIFPSLITSTGSTLYIEFTGNSDYYWGFEAMVFCPAEHSSPLSSYCPVTCDVCSPGCEAELDAGLERNTAMKRQDAFELSTGTGSVEYEALVECLMGSYTSRLGYNWEDYGYVSQRYGYASASGAACTACGSGTEPAANGAACVQCGAWHYSVGSQCLVCPPGTAPADGRSVCSPCTASNGYSPYGKSCLTCPAGFQPKYRDCDTLQFATSAAQDTCYYSMFTYIGAQECESCAIIAEQESRVYRDMYLDQIQFHPECGGFYDACVAATADEGCADDGTGFLEEVGSSCEDMLASFSCTDLIAAFVMTLSQQTIPEDSQVAMLLQQSLENDGTDWIPTVSSLCPASCNVCSIGCMAELEAGLQVLAGLNADDLSQMPSAFTTEYQDVMACLQRQTDLQASDLALRLPAGMISTSGARCDYCMQGKQPNDSNGACVDCTAGKYSGGDLCRRCPAGTRPSGTKSFCESCQLAGTNKYSSSGAACESCTAGSQPTDDRTSCNSCESLQVTENLALESDVYTSLRNICEAEYQACAATAPASDCVDDADGYLSSAGEDCDSFIAFVGGDCSVDVSYVFALHQLYGDSGKTLPQNYFLWQMCPVRCSIASPVQNNRVPTGQVEYSAGFVYVPTGDDSDGDDSASADERNCNVDGNGACSDGAWMNAFGHDCEALRAYSEGGQPEWTDENGAFVGDRCCQFCSSGRAVPYGEEACSSPAQLANGGAIDFTGGYGNDQTCVWNVACDSGDATITFSSFETEEGYDFVYIDTISQYDGADLPAPVSGGSTMEIRFESDDSDTMDGFAAEVTCAGGTPDTEVDEDISGAPPGWDGFACEVLLALYTCDSPASAFWPDNPSIVPASYTMGTICPVECTQCKPTCMAQIDDALHISTALMASGIDAWPTEGVVEYENLVGCLATADASYMYFHLYQVGRTSNDGNRCAYCDEGKEPNSAHGQCVPCGAGQYSVGDKCRWCPNGTRPSSSKGYCESCQLQGTNSYGPDGARCLLCAAGSQPNDERIACLTCEALTDETNEEVSAVGVQSILDRLSTVCPTLYEECVASSTCQNEFNIALLANELPQTGSTEYTDLLDCFSRDDVLLRTLIEMYSHRVGLYSLAGAACIECGNGKMPHPDSQGSCVDCGAGEYSGGDYCRGCAPGTQPSS
eukprot:COSAG06_NODE_3073_length_5891_cov_13.072514_3_plen_1258_part_01